MHLTQDLTFAIRSFGRTPGATALAVLTLALGVGANTAVFSVIHRTLVSPLDYPGADRIVLPWRTHAKLRASLLPDSRDVDRWAAATSVEAVARYSTGHAVLTGHGEPDNLAIARVGPGFLEFTGAVPRLGRPFQPEEYASDAAARVVLLTDALWRRRFGAARDVVGQPIELSDESFIIAGVLPPAFRMPTGTVDLLAPLVPPPAVEPGKQQGSFVEAMLRIRRGIPIDRARAELEALGVTGVGVGEEGDWILTLTPPTEAAAGSMRRALVVLLGAVGFVLLIACSNVAGILLARNAARRREFVIRSALGATRGRLVRQLLTETLLLAMAGGGLGLLVGFWAVKAVTALRPRELTALEHASMSGPVLAFSFVLALATALLFGLLPALVESSRAAEEVLQPGRRALGGRGSTLARRALTVVQVALALVLLAGAALLIQSYARLVGSDLGFVPARVLTVQATLPESRYQLASTRFDFYARLVEEVRALPAVQAATVALGAPPRGGMVFGSLEVEGRQSDRDAAGAAAFGGGWVYPGYFETLGIRVLEGRTFVDTDTGPNAPAVAIVSESIARRFWPGESPLGQRLRSSPKAPWSTVVGVVADVRSSPQDRHAAQVYTPMREESAFPRAVLMVRTEGDPLEVIGPVKGLIWRLDPKLPVQEILTLEQRVKEALAGPRFSAVVLVFFAGLGLLLALVGVYGVISHSVSARTQEIGVRIAVGAMPRHIMRRVLGEAAVLAVTGVAIGTAAALALTRLVETMLFETSSRDPWTLLLVSTSLILAALLAAWRPARRATRVDPLLALRVE